MKPRTLLVLSIVALLAFTPNALLGDGLSGGKVLSPRLLWRDIISMQPAALLRLFAWASVVLPPLGIIAAMLTMMKERRQKAS